MTSPAHLALVIGIDVGFSATKHTTGVILIDRVTKMPVNGSKPIVLQQPEAMTHVEAELDRLKPSTVTACVDGPFHHHAAAGQKKARAVERFFTSGPFAAIPPRGGQRLRLMPAPTRAGGEFLTNTLEVLMVLSKMSIASQNPLSACGSDGTAVETFPTVFMATLLPPEQYTGKRGDHSDDLWARLATATQRSAASPLIAYLPLMVEVDAAPSCDRHDLRAAAVCAIAADLVSENGPEATFIGTADEGGFLLPPVAWWDAKFRRLVEDHLANRKKDLGLEWREIGGRATGLASP